MALSCATGLTFPRGLAGDPASRWSVKAEQCLSSCVALALQVLPLGASCPCNAAPERGQVRGEGWRQQLQRLQWGQGAPEPNTTLGWDGWEQSWSEVALWHSNRHWLLSS